MYRNIYCYLSYLCIIYLLELPMTSIILLPLCYLYPLLVTIVFREYLLSTLDTRDIELPMYYFLYLLLLYILDTS